MNNSIKEIKHRAASIASSYIKGHIEWQTFMDEMADLSDKDSLIDKLIDLIEHEPKRGGFMGVSEKKWENYQTAIHEIIKELEE